MAWNDPEQEGSVKRLWLGEHIIQTFIHIWSHPGLAVKFNYSLAFSQTFSSSTSLGLSLAQYSAAIKK
jgi:hypothetical protein